MTVGAGHSDPRIDPGQEQPARVGRKWPVVLGGLIASFVALAGYDLTSVSGQTGSTAVASAARTAPATNHSPTQAGHQPRSSPTTRRAQARDKAAPPVPRALGVTSVAAFGPDGLSDGDNPAMTSQILDVSSDQPWYSQWYATPQFGNLRSGTGLLLDMGKTVTVSSVQLVLGTAPGADVQIRVGDSPYPADLSSVASAFDVGGTVRLSAATPTRERYVLIWFTRLPPGPQGHYQIDVYDLTVDGTSSH